MKNEEIARTISKGGLSIDEGAKLIENHTKKALVNFQAWQLDKGYLDRNKVKNGMVQEYLNENK